MWWPDKVLHKKVTITSRYPRWIQLNIGNKTFKRRETEVSFHSLLYFFLSSSSSPSSSPAIHFAN